MKAVRALVTVAVAAAIGRVVLGCVIDLDPVLDAEARTPEAGEDAGGDSPSVPGNADARDVATEASAECTMASDCQVGSGPGSGCVTPSCRAGRCEFSFCSASKCGQSRCDTSSGIGKCTAEEDAGFVVKDLGPVSLNVACKDVSRCIAVSHPLVFMANGPPSKPITAYNVGDLAKPIPIEVTGLSMDPQYVVSSGTKVYFIALPSAGAAGNVGITIGWVDLPPNPYVTKLVARQVDLPFSGGALAGAFPAPGGALFLATNTGQIARVAPGVDDAGVNAVRPFNLSTVARFLSQSEGQLTFGVIGTGAGVGSVTAGILFNPGAASGAITSVSAAPLGRVPTPQLFGAPGPDGSVIATLAVGDVDASSQAVVNVKSTKLLRIVAPDDQGISLGPSVDLAVYQPASSDSGALTAATRAVASPSVVGDDILALTHLKDGSTLAQAVSLDPDGGQPVLESRFLSVPTTLFTSTLQTVGTSASGGFAYLFAATKDGGVSLILMKPGCD